MVNTSIVAAGIPFDIGCRVVLWDEPGGMSFYKGKKYSGRNVDLVELRNHTKCFVIHHADTYTAKQTYASLIGRGLSVNFIIDDDSVDGVSTIYQCLDIKDGGWSQAPLNQRGPGVEISYRPLASTMAQAYSVANQVKHGVQPHSIEDDVIHGVKLRVFPPSEPQVNACIAMLWGFSELFPDVPPEFPKDAAGNVPKTVVANAAAYEGFLAHFHVTRGKIDPSGFPFDYVENEVKLRRQCGF